MDGSFKSFENGTVLYFSVFITPVQLSAKETKWTSLEVRTHPTFLETLISKYDFGPVSRSFEKRAPGGQVPSYTCHTCFRLLRRGRGVILNFDS